MIYVASTYTVGDATPETIQKRFEFVEGWVANKLKEGVPVFSPIVYNHVIALKYDMPKDWGFWEDIDLKFMDVCDKHVVLKMPMWEHSRGITAEIAYARDFMGIPVEYVDVEYFE